jgi:hypothetical protein
VETGAADPGRVVARSALPVPAPPPPGVTDVIRRGTRLGLGALGLAGRAAGTLFARVPDPTPAGAAEPAVLALIPGAVAGMAIEVERRASTVIDGVAARASGMARAVSAPRVVQRALRPVEDALWHWNEVARREQDRNQAQAAALIPVIVQQATENVIAQLDFVRIVQQVPVDDIVASLDIEGIVARIDLGGVIRESTASLTTEAVDALRSEGIAADGWIARVVDKVMLRRQPRELEVGGAVGGEA